MYWDDTESALRKIFAAKNERETCWCIWLWRSFTSFLMQLKSRGTMVWAESNKTATNMLCQLSLLPKVPPTYDQSMTIHKSGKIRTRIFSDKFKFNFNRKQETGNKTNQQISSQKRAQSKQPVHAKCRFDFSSSNSRRNENFNQLWPIIFFCVNSNWCQNKLSIFNIPNPQTNQKKYEAETNQKTG